MRYISPLYDEKILIRKLAQMRLTSEIRDLEPLHDRRGIAATAATGAAIGTEPTFFSV